MAKKVFSWNLKYITGTKFERESRLALISEAFEKRVDLFHLKLRVIYVGLKGKVCILNGYYYKILKLN